MVVLMLVDLVLVDNRATPAMTTKRVRLDLLPALTYTLGTG